MDAVLIVLFRSYDKEKAPPSDETFRSNLLSTESPFVKLLDINDNAAAEAERIVEGALHVFDRSVNINDADFSWHKDFMSGKSYPLATHPIIRIEPGQGHDIIVPWELSRLQFIPTLIAAHRKIGDERYPRQFRVIVDNWIAANPLMRGVNWITGMDVAIRGINLALGLLYFGRFLEGSVPYYSKVLWSHAEYIHKYDVLRSSGRHNNHMLVSLVGLLGISACFKGERARLFRNMAFAHLEKEIALQFRTDGGNFESAVHYHQVSLEAVLIANCFMQVEQMDKKTSDRVCTLSESNQEKIAKACTLVSDYLGAFGCSPQFGDSSDGRTLIYKDYFSWDPGDHSFIRELSRIAIPDCDTPNQRLGCHMYQESGYGFFANQRYGVCLCASPSGKPGQGGRGHNHCDKGSLVLQVGGQPVFVDSGTYCYTPDELARSSFRSTKSHNVLMLDGLEQAKIRQGSFCPLDDIETHISIHDDEQSPEWKMTHTGYSRIDGLGEVGRSVKCCGGRLIIEDTAEGVGEHDIEILWHLHPDIECEIHEDSIHFTFNSEPLCRMLIPQGFDVKSSQGTYSAEYGVKTENTIISLCKYAKLPITVQYSILI